MDLRFELFGGLRVVRDGEAIDVASKTQRRILTALLLQGGQSVPSERLIDWVWGEDVPTSGERALHFHMSKLRDTLEPEREAGTSSTVETTPGGYRLKVKPSDIDIHAWMGEVDTVADELDRDAGAALRLIDDLRSTYRDPIPEFAYEDFAQESIRRVQRELGRLEQLYVDALTAVGRTEDATKVLEALHENDPFDESIVAKLVMLLYRSGRQADALRTYDRTRERLVDELGIDPSPALEAAHLRVLQQDPHLLDAPESRVPAQAPHNLPADPLPLVGREAELAELSAAMAVSRLVSLTGVSGIGKSRLAQAWARRNRTSYSDGVIYLNVGRMADGSDLSAELATGLAAATGRALAPVNATAFVADANSLVLLDDVAQRADTAAFVDQLLAGEGCRVLMTADDASSGRGSVIAIAPLDEGPAVELFEQARAALGRPGDAELYGKTIDAAAGIPAGIVAAAYATRLGDPETAARVASDEVGGLVGRSIAVASESARSAIRDLTQFHSSFGLADAQRVLTDARPLDVLSELVDRGLLITRHDGLEMPVSTRLAAAGLGQVPAAAAAGYQDAVLDWVPSRLVERSADTERVLGHLAAQDPPRAAALLGRAMARLWETGRHAQMLAWCRLSLRPELELVGRDAERVLYYTTHAALSIGDRVDAGELQQRHARVAESLGGPARIYAQLIEADIAWYDGEAESANDAYQRAARLASDLEHPEGTTGLFGTGVVAAHTGRYDAASASADYIVASTDGATAQPASYLASELYGLVALGRGDMAAAIGHLTHAMRSPNLTGRTAAGRRLIAAHLANDDTASAATTWALVEDDLRRAAAPADIGVAYTGALLHHALGDSETASRMASDGARLVITSPAATWVSSALAVTAIIDSTAERRRAAAELLTNHAHHTGILPLPPLDRALIDKGEAGAFELDAALAVLRASADPAA